MFETVKGKKKKNPQKTFSIFLPLQLAIKYNSFNNVYVYMNIFA